MRQKLKHFKRNIAGLAFFVGLGIHQGAQAQILPSLYIGAAGSLNSVEEASLSARLANVGSYHAAADTDVGQAAMIYGGVDMGLFRYEAELSGRQNPIAQVRDQRGWASAQGYVTSVGAMVNGYIDIPTLTPVTPYAGAGLGLAVLNVGLPLDERVDWNERRDLSALEKGVPGLAYQAMVGARFDVGGGLSVGGEYRYMNVRTPNMARFLPTLGGRNLDAEANYQSHGFWLGLTFRLSLL